MKCPNCGKKVELEYDIWDNSYWHCKCGAYSWEYIRASANTEQLVEE